MIEIRWLGRVCQGAFTSSRLLGIGATIYEGKNSIAFPSFGPERRGAPVNAFTKIDDKRIKDRSQSLTCDYFVILDDSLYKEEFLDNISSNGKLIINTVKEDKFRHIKDRVVMIDASSLAGEFLNNTITNTAMLAALVASTEIISLESTLKAIDYEMKGSKAEKNKRLIKYIFEKLKEGELNG